MWIKNPWDSVPVCGGRGGRREGRRGTQLALAFLSISFHSCKVGPSCSPTQTCLLRGPRPALRSIAGRWLLKAGRAALCPHTFHATASLCHHGSGEALLLSPQAFTDAPELDKPLWLWDLQTPGPRGPHSCIRQLLPSPGPRGRGVSPPPHLTSDTWDSGVVKSLRSGARPAGFESQQIGRAHV